uniref:Uncharacterized protein n=1 Tax=Periophthalmus magnuspinnatus TaxID=409849 RepID=A0A3B3ZUJ4_9GOBI
CGSSEAQNLLRVLLQVWQLALPLPAIFLITVGLYMLLLGTALWLRYCLKVEHTHTHNYQTMWEHYNIDRNMGPFNIQSLIWVVLCQQCSNLDCACTCQPPECDTCNCLCFEIRIK